MMEDLGFDVALYYVEREEKQDGTEKDTISIDGLQSQYNS